MTSAAQTTSAAQQHIAGEDASSVMGRLFAPGLEDPYPLYDWLRANTPVHFSNEMHAFVLTRFADCERVLRIASLFPAPDESVFYQMMPERSGYDAFRVLVTSIVNSNPPKHTRLRQLVSKAFTARRVESLKHDVLRIAADQVRQVAARSAADGTPIDLHTELSVPVPLRVMAQLLGLPLEHDRMLADLIPRMINIIDPSSDEAAMRDADVALHALFDTLWDLVERRRSEPREDLVSALVAVEPNGADRLSDDEIRGMLVSLLTAGFETSATAIDNSILTLLRYPEHRAGLDTLDGCLRFVDEVLRWDPPSQMSAGLRLAAEDTSFGEYQVAAGAPVSVLFGAANRDPEANADPHRFDPHRQNPRSLVFGGGIHHCLGVNLARMEIAAVMLEIAEHLPRLSVAEPPVRRRSLPLRDFASFRVRFS